jgi:hypothetical protein
LTTATLVRSAALSAAAGILVLVGGVIAGFRTQISSAFEDGLSRTVFEAVTLALPRLSSLAQAAGDIAASTPLEVHSLGTLLTGVMVFGFGALAVGFWRFEGKDY